MANCNDLFKDFNSELNITKTKKENLITSRDNLRQKVKDYFKEHHNKYQPQFYIQGSYKNNTCIRTKDDECDLDDGVYFKDNPDNVTPKTLQQWVKNAVKGTTNAIPIHKKKCIRVIYQAGYNIDIPVFLFDKEEQEHPLLAVKTGEWFKDDPKEFVDEFIEKKKENSQIVRIVKYLKSWSDHKREKMPSGLVMTVLVMDNFQSNDRDDVSLKYTLIEIENELQERFKCKLPTTPKEDLFAEYSQTRKDNFLSNLSDFISDAKKAIDDEKNQYEASKLWKKHLGQRFPEGKDIEEETKNAERLISTIGLSKPFGYV